MSVLIMISSCIEPTDVETGEFLDALVVDATITDELKNQIVFLSRTYEFEQDGPEAVEGATIGIETQSGGSYDFVEVSPGVYQSVVPFAAESGEFYTLEIGTANGGSYASRPMQLPENVAIDSVYAERILNDFGEDGVSIFVDSFDSTGNSENFRYEYTETYKIVAPEWTPFDLLSTGIECGVDIVPKDGPDQVCFASDASNGIILASTTNLGQSSVERFPVRFLNRNNYIISHRYSLEVRQFTLSNEAYNFFSTLEEFTSSESLFTETQPGFLVGNVFATNDENEKVLGYFDVSTVSRKRIFFNYEDFFAGDPLPPFVDPCDPIAPKLISQGGARCILSAMVDEKQVSYLEENQDPPFEEGPYFVVPRECGDCTVLGTVETPNFWIE